MNQEVTYYGTTEFETDLKHVCQLPIL